MKFVELNKSLKEKVENVYNLKGEDLFLLRQAVVNIKSYLIKDLEEFNYIRIDAEKAKASEILANISALPIGNDYRLVVLDNPSIEAVKCINKFDFSDLNVVVVCLNANGLQVGEVVDCSKLDRQDISKYILNYLSKNKLSIEERALDYIIDATNGDMSKISNELNKIVSYVSQSETINMEIVTNLVANSSEYAIFMLTSAIDNKDFTQYQKILNEMSKLQSMGELFSYLGRFFKRMQYICLNKNDDELSKILNIKPYAIKMSRQNIAKNGINFYLNLYNKYIELDYKIKSGKITPQNAMYELVF